MGDTGAAERDEFLSAVLQLSLTPGIGPRTFRVLVDHFGSPQRAASASANELARIGGVGSKLMRAILDARQQLDIAGELKLCRDSCVSLLTSDDEPYPPLLKEIYDPPIVLYSRGELAKCDALAIAMVGTRHATSYGVRQAERLAAGLARAGLTIVSGLARGIDAAAHRGALLAAGAPWRCWVAACSKSTRRNMPTWQRKSHAAGRWSAKRRRSAGHTAACSLNATA
jgi:DNA processing protein